MESLKRERERQRQRDRQTVSYGLSYKFNKDKMFFFLFSSKVMGHTQLPSERIVYDYILFSHSSSTLTFLIKIYNAFC